MAERRQRIMRKYLRNHSNIAQSDLEVPGVQLEDEGLVESEHYKNTPISLQRKASGTSIPPPPPRRPPPQTGNSNWLLAADPLLTDPFALPGDREEPAKKKTDGSTWGREQESSSYGGVQYESWFGSRNKGAGLGNGSRNGSRQEGLSTSRGYNPFSFGGKSFGSQQQESAPYSSRYSSLFGRKPEASSFGSGYGTLDFSRERTEDPTLNQGGLQIPFSRESTLSVNGALGVDRKGQTYVPYKSFYETRRQQQQNQQPPWGGQTQQKPEYKRVDPYKAWKKRTPVYDPMGNDAFVNEHLPKRTQ